VCGFNGDDSSCSSIYIYVLPVEIPSFLKTMINNFFFPFQSTYRKERLCGTLGIRYQGRLVRGSGCLRSGSITPGTDGINMLAHLKPNLGKLVFLNILIKKHCDETSLGMGDSQSLIPNSKFLFPFLLFHYLLMATLKYVLLTFSFLTPFST
jgi:hypothetical protein